jgi:hypothetical protein
MRRRVCVLASCGTLLIAGSAAAQKPGRIPAAVFDVRGFYTPFGQDPTTALNLHVGPQALPTRGLGGVVDVQVYPLRRQRFAIGIGGEALLAHAHAQATDETGLPIGDPVHQRLRGIAGSFSLNFGHRDGWSYLTAGMGPMSFSTYLGDQAPAAPPPTQMTLNLGGGARWFATKHLAFCFDVRFYQTKPEVITPSYPGRQRSNLRVLSAGIALRR